MFRILRIICTIISALCLAIAVPLGVSVNLVWLGITLGAALIFFLLMLLCKQEQERRETPLNHDDKTDALPSGHPSAAQTEEETKTEQP